MRYFSIEEANDLVPLLQTTFQRVRAHTGQVGLLSAQLAARGDRSDPGEPVPEELSADHRELRVARDALVGEIREAVGGLLELGIEVKRLDGVVDFRSRRGGQPVNLCWRFGEERVDHWHELAAADGLRREIEGPARFEPRWMN